MNEPIAYCVDLKEDALIEASKILGLDPTDVNFLDTPLYTHPIRELTDAEIRELSCAFMLVLRRISEDELFENVYEYSKLLLKKASDK